MTYAAFGQSVSTDWLYPMYFQNDAWRPTALGWVGVEAICTILFSSVPADTITAVYSWNEKSWVIVAPRDQVTNYYCSSSAAICPSNMIGAPWLGVPCKPLS